MKTLVSKKTKLASTQTAAIGEHYVLSRLTYLEFIVGFPPPNMKTVDLIATTEDGEQSLLIQVKTRTQGRSSDGGWHMRDKHECITTKNLFYVFVTLPPIWSDNEQPTTHIIPAAVVASVLKTTHQEWMNTPGQIGQQHNDSPIRRIMPQYKWPQSVLAGWMNEYADNWDILEKCHRTALGAKGTG